MTVTLRDVDRENFMQCVKPEVREEQKGFVAPNVFSIAQSADNTCAQKLYESLGFRKTGAAEHGEDVMRLKFWEQS